MTLRRKHSRRISIDGVSYRWVVRDRPTYAQAVGHSNLSVAVEREDMPACVLRLVLPVTRRDAWLLGPGYIVQPRDLSRWIPKALAGGWEPGRRGPGFELRLAAEDLEDHQRVGERLTLTAGA